MKDLILGIDIGTSACKVIAFDNAGKAIAGESLGYPIYYPDRFCVEQNPEEWYSSVCQATNAVFKKVSSKRIKAVGISGQGWSCIPVDINGNVLYNNMIWMDTRAQPQCEFMLNKCSADEIFAVSGNPLAPNYVTPKLLWLKDNIRGVYDKTYKILQSNSFIGYKLTGIMSSDYSQAYAYHFFNAETLKFDFALASKWGIDAEKIPKLYACDEFIGEVTDIAEKESGIPKGTPVIAGGLDAACGTLGVGVIQNGQTQEQGGQAGGMSVCCNTCVKHPKLILSPHVIQNRWLLQGGTVGGGAALRWFCDQLGDYEKYLSDNSKENVYDLLMAKAQEAPPGSEGILFLPYLNGERSPIWDPNAKGVFYGLQFSTKKSHIIRAVLEGVAYSLKHNLCTVYETGAKITEMYTVGGAAKSILWTQIKSDVTGIPITVSNSDTATAWGAAMLATKAAGIYSNYTQAVEASVAAVRKHIPDKSLSKTYENGFKRYIQLYEGTKTLSV